MPNRRHRPSTVRGDAALFRRLVIGAGETDQYASTRLAYAKNGNAVSYVMGESWTWTGGAASPVNYDIAYAHEYRYDNARQRYLDRTLNISALMQGSVSAVSQLWTDYDGDDAYGDFTLNGGTVTNIRSFEPGLARTDDPLGLSGLPVTDYYHGDMIGTTRLMTDPSGLPIEPAVYTAFGERISGSMNGPEDRYGYAGAWGYQSHDEFPFLHVGARYYDPETGRFLQRDPIGIGGGLNVYVYARNKPATYADPEGYWPRDVIGKMAVKPPREGASIEEHIRYNRYIALKTKTTIGCLGFAGLVPGVTDFVALLIAELADF